MANNDSVSDVQKAANSLKNAQGEYECQNIKHQVINRFSKEKENAASNTYIEFGTVMIYTCQNSCLPLPVTQPASKTSIGVTTYRQEQVMLQSESI